MLFSQLPKEIQESVKSTLCAYSSVRVYRKKDGSFYSATVIAIHNGEYDEFIGEYEAKEIFTASEIKANYEDTFRERNANEIITDFVQYFREFPHNYRGKRDFTALNSNWTSVKMIEGNLSFN